MKYLHPFIENIFPSEILIDGVAAYNTDIIIWDSFLLFHLVFEIL